jgi:hypothetical protein
MVVVLVALEVVLLLDSPLPVPFAFTMVVENTKTVCTPLLSTVASVYM